MTEPGQVTIRVPMLARVEGEGALDVSIRDGAISEVRLRIYEPPRLFEKLLEGRSYAEVPDIVARICGICPVAYQLSAVQAIESAFGVQVSEWIGDLRRAMYCGEWIQSHALHIHLLAAPDFLDADSVIALAAKHPDEVRRGLRLQALGNDLIRLFGGRSVHPVGVCVGGFHRLPEPAEVTALAQRLRSALPDAEALVAWTGALPLPADEQSFVSVALRHCDEYAICDGRIVSSGGLDIGSPDYELHFEERQVPHSTALHSQLDGGCYLVGPLARLNTSHERLPQPVREALARAGIDLPGRNMFHSIVARAAEIYFALLEAIRILDAYVPGISPQVPVTPRAGAGTGATEAPRGLLWHRYDTDGEGRILRARIVPPTSQNQARIEQDLKTSLEGLGLDRPVDELRRRGEMVIRNYDPCISCATHVLNLTVDRR